MDRIKISRKRSALQDTLMEAPVFQIQELVNHQFRPVPGIFFTAAEAHRQAAREGYAKDKYRIWAMSAVGQLRKLLNFHTEEDVEDYEA